MILKKYKIIFQLIKGPKLNKLLYFILFNSLLENIILFTIIIGLNGLIEEEIKIPILDFIITKEILFWILILSLLINFILSTINSQIISKKLYGIGEELSNTIFEKYYNNGPNVFSKINPTYIERFIHYDISRLIDGLILPFFILFSKILIISPLLIFLISKINLISILIVSFLLIVIYIPLKKINNLSKKNGETLSKSYDKRLQFLKSAILTYTENWIDNKNLKFSSEFRNINKSISNSISFQYFTKSLPKIIIEFITFSTIIILINFSYDKVDKSLFYISIPIALKIIPIFQQIMIGVNQIRGNIDSLNSLETFINDYNNFYFKLSNEDFKNFELKEFKILRKNNSNTLSKEFKLNDEKSILITGPSGSGKTSLIQALIGINDFGERKIISNQKLLDSYFNVTNQLSYLGQEQYFFNGSLKNNLGLEENSNFEYFFYLVRNLNLTHIIRNKESIENPEFNYNKLSGGEKQRIGIIKSLMNPNRIKIWDEPTKGLDKKNVKILSSVINNEIELNNLKFIIITHDSEFIKNLNLLYFENIEMKKLEEYDKNII